LTTSHIPALPPIRDATNPPAITFFDFISFPFDNNAKKIDCTSKPLLTAFRYATRRVDPPTIRYLEGWGDDMQKLLNGVFDNQETMQREAWKDGEIVGLWPSTMCDGATQTLMPWERKVLEEPWGFYPSPPRAPL
jgi:hypothetical protein